MTVKRPIVKIIICTSALGLAFWGGRVSSLEKSARSGDEQQPGVRAQQRAARKNPPRDMGAGAGGEALANAEQIRDIFKRSGRNTHLGSVTAQLALKKMNATELSALVHDLADAQASTSDYSYRYEIQAACERWAELDPDAALAFTLSNKQNVFRTAAINSIFKGMAAYDPELALSKLSEIDDPETENSARLTVLRALAVSNPDLWISEIKERPRLWQNISITTAVSEWFEDDPKLALARLQQLPRKFQIQGLSTIGSLWASKNPQAAVAWAESLTDKSHRRQAIRGIASGMATKDPQGALKILDLLGRQSRMAGFTSVIGTLAHTDFDCAIELARSLPNDLDQKLALSQLLGGSQYSGGWSSHRDHYGGGHTYATVSQLRELADQLPPGSLRKQALGQLGIKMAAYPPEKIDQLMQGYTENEKVLMQTTMLQKLSYSDPERALELYDSMPANKRKHNQYNQILSYLAQRDPEASLERAMKAKTPQLQAQQASSAIRILATNDPSGTATRFAKLPDGPLRDNALSTVASAWSQSDPQAAIRWAEGLSTKEKNKAYSKIVPTLARSDPKAAAAIVERALAIDEKGSSWSVSTAARAVVETMAMEDPSVASAWIDRLPEGSTQTNAIGTLARGWSFEDIDGAADWLNSLPDGKGRDSGIKAVVGTISSKDPAAAFAWANSVGDDNQRISSMRSVVYDWKRQDPDEARAAIERVELSDKERDQLMKILK